MAEEVKRRYKRFWSYKNHTLRITFDGPKEVCIHRSGVFYKAKYRLQVYGNYGRFKKEKIKKHCFSDIGFNTEEELLELYKVYEKDCEIDFNKAIYVNTTSLTVKKEELEKKFDKKIGV